MILTQNSPNFSTWNMLIYKLIYVIRPTSSFSICPIILSSTRRIFKKLCKDIWKLCMSSTSPFWKLYEWYRIFFLLATCLASPVTDYLLYTNVTNRTQNSRKSIWIMPSLRSYMALYFIDQANQRFFRPEPIK